MSAISYTQSFDGLSSADLSGQDSWSGGGAGATQTVESTTVLDGTKSVECNLTSINKDADYRRTVSDNDSGDFFFAFRVEDSGGNKSFQFRDNGGAGTVFFIGIPGSTAVSWSGDKVTLYGTAANTVESTFSTATKYYCNCQWDDVNQNDKARARVWRSGTGWGSWTSWVAVTAYTKINQIRVDMASGDGTGTMHAYYDTFQQTDPTPPSDTGDQAVYSRMQPYNANIIDPVVIRAY